MRDDRSRIFVFVAVCTGLVLQTAIVVVLIRFALRDAAALGEMIDLATLADRMSQLKPRFFKWPWVSGYLLGFAACSLASVGWLLGHGIAEARNEFRGIGAILAEGYEERRLLVLSFGRRCARRIGKLLDRVPERAAWVVLSVALGLWFAYPFWVVPLLPLGYLPGQIAATTVLRHLHDPIWNLQPFYRVGHASLPVTFHLFVATALSYLCGSPILAYRALLSAMVLVVPWFGQAYAGATGRSKWLALLLLPIVTGWLEQWGLEWASFGCILALYSAAALHRLCETPTWKRAVVLGATACALYLCDSLVFVSCWLYALGLIGVAMYQRRERPIWRGLPPLFIAAILPLIDFLRFHQILFSPPDLVEGNTPASFLKRSIQMMDLFRPTAREEWIAVGLGATLFILLLSDGARRARVNLPVILAPFVFLLGGVYLASLSRPPFASLLETGSLVTLAAATAVFLPHTQPRGARALVLGIAITASTLLPPLAAARYRDFYRRAVPLIRLIKMTPLGSSTLVLHTKSVAASADPALMADMPIWRELVHLPVTYRGGDDPYLREDSVPLQFVRALPHPPAQGGGRREIMARTFDAAQFTSGWDYFIVRGNESDLMPPDGTRSVEEAGDWMLYKNLLKDETSTAAAPADREP